ncbi:MAG: hypothetical protein QGG33_02550 [Candidatus Krumholzibacteria bacterium]|nr:hypothetical protein [Candidatus Krumholzibacteria bacterium]
MVYFNLEIAPGPALLDLSEVSLSADSLKLTLDGRLLLPGKEYHLSLPDSRLQLPGDFPGGFLELRCLKRPARLPRMQVLSPMLSWRELRAELPRKKLSLKSAGTQSPTSSLEMGGSKSLSLRLGSNEGYQLEQSLRLRLRGRVGKESVVEAVLRDDDLPFQSEGNTERLEELDKVFLRLEGPAGEAQVGDFVFQGGESDLSRFERDFQGLHGRWKGTRGELSLFLAQSRGVFKSEEFYAEEGLQGPYELLSALRSDGAVVLSGSEKVSLNGQLLRRGRDGDYVIDYDSATLLFSGSRPLRAGDRIRVDFRYSLESWRRHSSGFSALAKLGDWKFSWLHFEEGDREDSPLSFALDEERRGLLQSAGDESDLALTSGIEFLPGEGNYLLVDSLSPEAPAHYEWADSLGDYRLSFHEVESGEGDYQAAGISPQGIRFYSWVGEGQGSFRLGQKLALPESYRLETLGFSLQRERFRAGLELALSEKDRNLLSSLDEADNRGIAWWGFMEADLPDLAQRSLQFSLGAERRESRFREPGARPGWGEEREWNLRERPAGRHEDRAESRVQWKNREKEGLELGLKSLRFGQRFSALRGSLDFREDLRALGFRAAAQWTANRDSLEGEGLRQKVDLTLLTAAALIPDLNLQSEKVRFAGSLPGDSLLPPEQRSRWERQAVGLSFQSASSLSHLTIRREEIRSASTVEQIGELRGSLDQWSLLGGKHRLQAQYRQRRGFLDNEQFFLESSSVWPLKGEGWHGRASWRLGSRRQRLQESRLVYVGFGYGDLNEEGVYLGEGEGDTRRVLMPAEESVETRDLLLEASLLRAEGRKEGRRIASETRLRLREESRDAEILDLLLLRPRAFLKEAGTLNGELGLRQEFRFQPESAPWRLRYRADWQDRLDGRDLSGTKRDRHWTQELRFVRQFLRGELRMNASRKWLYRNAEGSLQSGSYDVLNHELGLEANAEGRFRPSLQSRLRWQSDALRDLALSSLVLEPRMEVRPWKSLRLQLSWEWVHTEYQRGDPQAGRPWLFEAPGWTRSLRLEGTARAGRQLSFTALYELREEGDRDPRQRLRLESRAYF